MRPCHFPCQPLNAFSCSLTKHFQFPCSHWGPALQQKLNWNKGTCTGQGWTHGHYCSKSQQALQHGDRQQSLAPQEDEDRQETEDGAWANLTASSHPEHDSQHLEWSRHGGTDGRTDGHTHTPLQVRTIIFTLKPTLTNLSIRQSKSVQSRGCTLHIPQLIFLWNTTVWPKIWQQRNAASVCS